MPRSMRSAARPEGPQSPPKRLQEVASSRTLQNTRDSSQESAGAKVSTRSKKALQSLPVVREAEPDEASDVEEDSEHDSGSDLDRISQVESDSSDDLEEELSAFDHEIIIESLPSLYQDALRIVTLFNPDLMPRLIDDLKSDKTSIGRRYRQLHSHFLASLRPFRRDDDEFIPTSAILTKLAGVYGPIPPKTAPDQLLYMANLAILAGDVIVNNDDSKFQRLANGFPDDQILGTFGDIHTAEPGGPTLPITTDIVGLSVALKTYLFMLEAAKHKDSDSFDPDELLQQAFFDDNDSVLGFERQAGDVMENIVDAHLQRMKQIRSCFSQDSEAPVDLKAISSRFPPQDVIALLVNWINLRRDELAKRVAVIGGAETISNQLLELATHQFEEVLPSNVDTDQQSPPLTAQAPERVSSARMSNRMQQLKRIKARHEAQPTQEPEGARQTDSRGHDHETPQSPLAKNNVDKRTSNVVQSKNFELMSEDDDELFHPPPTQGNVIPSHNTAKILAASQRQAAQSNKENTNVKETTRRFTDRQQGAKRVIWDGDSDDEGDFETDVRQIKRRKAAAQVEAMISDSNRALFGDVVGLDDDDDDDSNTKFERVDDRHMPPPSAQPAPSRSPLQEVRRPKSLQPLPSSAPYRTVSRESSSASNFPMASQAAIANQEAKNAVRQASVVSGPRSIPKLQVRHAWTEVETERLIDLVALHGAAWSTILKTDAEFPGGPVLENRGQVALKDKARNIKVDFLKASQPLPTGFEYVKIKASDVARLEEMGKVAHGGPTRTKSRDADET